MSEQSQPTVLYVDDDDHTRFAIRWIFHQAGFTVKEAATGQEALRLVAEKPDVVVLDVNLPDINGFEVCRRIKAHPATQSVPVLHLSAVYITAQDRAQGLDGGADSYLTKPVEPQELVAQINALLRMHHAEEKARMEARHWQATFDAIGDGVCLLDRHGRVLRCNQAAAQLAGRPVEEMVGRSYREITGDNEAAAVPLEAVLSSRQRKVAELARGDRWLQVSADPLPGADGDVAGAVYIVADVTAHRRLEEQLRQARTMETVGHLAGGIAHEFNNLLTVITGNVGLAKAALPAEDRNASLLHDAEQAAWRAANLVRQLLGFSRHNALRLQPVNVNACLAEVLGSLSRDLAPDIRVEVQAAPDLGTVHADAVQLHQVLMNLCLNARDAMPHGGLLTLVTSNQEVDDPYVRRNLDAHLGAFVRLRVSDTGDGIPPEVLPFIFDPYFTTKPVGKGSGMGLAMVHGIVKQHRGWLECTSQPGRGTTFDIFLPRAPNG